MDYDLEDSIPMVQGDGQPQRSVPIDGTLDLEGSTPESIFPKKNPIGEVLPHVVENVFNKSAEQILSVIRWPFKRFIEHPSSIVVTDLQEGKLGLDTVAKAGKAFVPGKIPENEYGSYGEIWRNYYKSVAQFKGYAPDDPEAEAPDWYLAIASYGTAMGVENPALSATGKLTEMAVMRDVTNQEAKAIRTFFEPLKKSLEKRGLKMVNLHPEGNIVVLDKNSEIFLNKNISAVLRGESIRVPRWAKIKMPKDVVKVDPKTTPSSPVVQPLNEILPTTGKEIILKANAVQSTGSAVAGAKGAETNMEATPKRTDGKVEQNPTTAEEVKASQELVKNESFIQGRETKPDQPIFKPQASSDVKLITFQGAIQGEGFQIYSKKQLAAIKKFTDSLPENVSKREAIRMFNETEAALSKELSPSQTKQIIREKTGQIKDEGDLVTERKAFLEVLKKQVQAAKQATKATKEEIFDTQSNLVKLINQSDLEAKDKAKFLTTIKGIQTAEDLQMALAPKINKKGEVTNPGLEARINSLIDKAERRQTISEIKDSVARIKDSGVIAVDYVSRVEDLVKDFELKKHNPETIKRLQETKKFIESQNAKGVDVEMPDSIMKKLDILNRKKAEDISTDDLKKLLGDINKLEDIGKTKLRVRKEIDALKKGKDLARIKTDSKPLVKINEIKAGIGDRLSGYEIAKNNVIKALNFAMEKDVAISPMDAFFDLLDGSKNYKGPNYEIFKKRVDIAYNDYLNRRGSIQNEVIDMSIDMNLDDGNFDRIGAYAALQQDGGLEKLISSGYKKAELDKIVLSADETKVYEAMRSKLDDLRPEIENVMRTVFNENLGNVENYFSFMTDFEAMSDAEIRDFFGNGVKYQGKILKKNTEKGFTKERLGGDQKIKINAMEIFLKHTDNASYLIHVGKETKYLGELAETPDYGMAVGEYGQEQVREWVDLIARKGKSHGNRIQIIDTLRKNTGVAVLAFKLSSALIQPTSLMDGASLIGNYVFKGASNISRSKWRKFIVNNFPEIEIRLGDDPGYLEFGGKSILDKASRVGMWPLQKLDGLTASSIASGAYEKFLNEHGLALDLNNVNKEALEYAQFIVRKTQASALFKDLPPAVSRGELTGNISVDKLILQFQNFMLNRYSLIRHDLYRVGIKGKDKQQALNIFFWLTMATVAGMGLRRASKEMVAFISGGSLEDWGETFTKEFVVDSLSSVPFVTPLVSATNYGSFPVPSISLVSKMINHWGGAVNSKKASTREKNVIRSIILALGVLGMPGAVQLDQYLGKAL